MKVLMCSREHPPSRTGGEGVFSGYAEKYLPGYGIDLTIISSDPKTRKVYKETRGNTVIYRLPVFGSTFLTKFPSFSLQAAGLAADLEKEHDLIYAFSSSLVPLKKFTRPLIAHFHTSRYGESKGCKYSGRHFYAFLNSLYISFDRRLLKSAAGVIAPSQNMVDDLRETGRMEKDFQIIPGGVDPDIFRPLGPRVFNAPLKNVLYAGRLDARKGIDILFRAFKAIKSPVEAKLIVAGDGIEKSKLLRLARSLKIPVVFTGKISQQDLSLLYNRADLLVMPSLYEPFGMAVLEAMACGTPAIASSACADLGMPRFAKADVESLKKALFETLGSEQKLKELSEKGLMISKRFSWDKVMLELAGYLKKFV